MAARVTGAEVLEIMDTTLTALQVQPFIDAATLVVDAVLADAEYSDGLEKEIERWYVAHLVAIRDPQVRRESFGGGASQEFYGTAGMGLDHTPYGQQVQILDHKGYFKAVQAATTIAEVKALR